MEGPAVVIEGRRRLRLSNGLELVGSNWGDKGGEAGGNAPGASS